MNKHKGKLYLVNVLRQNQPPILNTHGCYFMSQPWCSTDLPNTASLWGQTGWHKLMMLSNICETLFFVSFWYIFRFLLKGGFVNVLVMMQIMQRLQVEHHFNKRGTAVGGAGPPNIHRAYVDTRRKNDGGRFSLARRSWQLMCRSYVTPFIPSPFSWLTSRGGGCVFSFGMVRAGWKWVGELQFDGTVTLIISLRWWWWWDANCGSGC